MLRRREGQGGKGRGGGSKAPGAARDRADNYQAESRSFRAAQVARTSGKLHSLPKCRQ